MSLPPKEDIDEVENKNGISNFGVVLVEHPRRGRPKKLRDNRSIGELISSGL